jgi:hypothetical protein
VYSRFLAGTTVTIHVGEDRHEFKLSKDLLCHVSPFFKAAFEGEFKEGKEQTMELLDDNVQAFEHIVSYIYRGDFGRSTTQMKTDCYCSIKNLSIAIYLVELAERLQISDMKHAALHSLVSILRHDDVYEPTVDDVELAFNLLSADSKAIEEIVLYVADNFLRSKLDLRRGLKSWKFEPLMTSVEDFHLHLLFGLKTMGLRRVDPKHRHNHVGCPPMWGRDTW